MCFSLNIFLFFVFLSIINKSISVRRLYVNMLLKLFEFGRENIETTAEKQKKKQIGDSFLWNSKKNIDNTSKWISSKKKFQQLFPTNSSLLISRDSVLLPTVKFSQPNSVAKNRNNVDVSYNEEITFNLEKCLDYVKAGVEAIIEDEVTSRFEAEELRSWNLLTRTNRRYEFISWKITVIWLIGFTVRYFVLMPLRVVVCFLGVIWLTACTACVGSFPEGKRKRRMVEKVLRHCFSVLSSAISAVIHYHNIENRPTGGICVANHTSPIDVLVLMCDTTYSLIGQRHSGFLGLMQRALARASPHIWFERAEAKDRHSVAERLKQHVSDLKNPPILIFPEGTCINNTSVMQFKKGSFEVGGAIYPVAIKYDPRFGDAFWNSSKYSMTQYLYMMMTSWAIVCDVWYLPPMYQRDEETAIDFANRVKSVIAKQGGLVDLVWDGQLKRMKPKKEWKEMQQIGQRHSGFLGLMQRALARASPHIWFERAEAKDRHSVAERLKQHVSDLKNPPILIFPEGTCINNTSVMQFKKGSFEVGGAIYPVAIKYDPRFGDAFWNSSKYSMTQYLYMMMTSWAIVCDVWYLPPMYQRDEETAIDFANRVKSVIAKQGGLVDLVWERQLKRMKPKKEWKEMQQVEFTKRLKCY